MIRFLIVMTCCLWEHIALANPATDVENLRKVIAIQQAEILNLKTEIAKLNHTFHSVISSDGRWIGQSSGLIGPEGPQGPQGPQGNNYKGKVLCSNAHNSYSRLSCCRKEWANSWFGAQGETVSELGESLVYCFGA